MTGQKITKAIVKILNYCNVKFAVLGARIMVVIQLNEQEMNFLL